MRWCAQGDLFSVARSIVSGEHTCTSACVPGWGSDPSSLPFTFVFLLFLRGGDRFLPSPRQFVSAETAPWPAVLLAPLRSHSPAMIS